MSNLKKKLRAAGESNKIHEKTMVVNAGIKRGCAQAIEQLERLRKMHLDKD